MAVGPSGFWATKDVHSLMDETHEEGHTLRRSVGPVGLTAMGVGAIIGTGIFVVIGEGAAEAGPAVAVSFVLAAVTCLFSALSYSELASSVPVSGSAYTYSYATLGELVAFIIGWDLILEYGVSVAAVAVGWGGNFNSFLDSAFGVRLPDAIATAPEDGGVFNLPAVIIVLSVTLLLVRGTRESAAVNLVMVGVKLVVLTFFIIAAFTSFKSSNLEPFNPEGVSGITTAAGLIFFAYIGFDAVSTASEESKNPARDLPIAIVGSLMISTIFYILVAIGAIGLVPAADLAGSEAPLADALQDGAGLDWAAAVLALGAVIAITSVLLVILYGQTRIFFAMCRDGLMPLRFAEVSPRFGTPAKLTMGFGVLIAVLAAFVPLSEIVKLVNIGTLFAFILVNIGVIILRRTRPDMERPFRVPFSPVFPLIGIALCLWLMKDLPLVHLDPVRASGSPSAWPSTPSTATSTPGCATSVPAERVTDGRTQPPGRVRRGADRSRRDRVRPGLGRVHRRHARRARRTPGQSASGVGRVDAEWGAYERKEAEAVLDEARELLAGVENVEFRRIDSSSPAHGLSDVIEQGGTMLVLGARRARGLRRTYPGSTAERLLHGSAIPIAIVPSDYAIRHTGPLRTVTAAYVDTPDGRHALEAAATMARHLGARLDVVSVVPDTRIVPSAGEPRMFADRAARRLPHGTRRRGRLGVGPGRRSPGGCSTARSWRRWWRSAPTRRTCWCAARAATARWPGSCSAACPGGWSGMPGSPPWS